MAASALLLTLVFVWIGNRFEFAAACGSPVADFVVSGSRHGSFVRAIHSVAESESALGHAIGGAPDSWLRRAALTVTERPDPANPFTELLAEDALRIAREHERERTHKRQRSFRGFFISASGGCWGALMADRGRTGLLGLRRFPALDRQRSAGTPPLYDIAVQPGNKTIRRKSDQAITAQLNRFLRA